MRFLSREMRCPGLGKGVRGNDPRAHRKVTGVRSRSKERSGIGSNPSKAFKFSDSLTISENVVTNTNSQSTAKAIELWPI